jgi:hypothetical protein
MIHRKISMKNHFTRQYSVVNKEFNDEQHLNNYLSLMGQRGYKIISIYKHNTDEKRSI